MTARKKRLLVGGPARGAERVLGLTRGKEWGGRVRCSKAMDCGRKVAEETIMEDVSNEEDEESTGEGLRLVVRGC